MSALADLPLDRVVELQRRLLALHEQSRRSRLPSRLVVETGLIALMDQMFAVRVEPPALVAVQPATAAVVAPSVARAPTAAFRSAGDLASALGGIVVGQ